MCQMDAPVLWMFLLEAGTGTGTDTSMCVSLFGHTKSVDEC